MAGCYLDGRMEIGAWRRMKRQMLEADKGKFAEVERE
jgi:hypothetical protein